MYDNYEYPRDRCRGISYKKRLCNQVTLQSPIPLLKEDIMPGGPGTYGTKKGRPPKRKPKK